MLSGNAGGFEEALTWLFTPDFSKIGPGTVLAAVSQAFFSIGVAMAGMMTYGSYLPKSISISQSVLIIVIADTAVALLAGLVIFPAVFHHGLDPAEGAGLIFHTLPVAFAQMPGGYLFSILFFLMLTVAGITLLDDRRHRFPHARCISVVHGIPLIRLDVPGVVHLAQFSIGHGLDLGNTPTSPYRGHAYAGTKNPGPGADNVTTRPVIGAGPGTH